MTRLVPERLKRIREQLGLNKTETAKLLGLTKMGYGRYESGERSPSFQSISFMADALGTSVEYLTGESDDPASGRITIIEREEPGLYYIADSYHRGDEPFRKRLLGYCRGLRETQEGE